MLACYGELMKSYPRLGRTDRHDKNTSARCRCGELGTAKVHVEYTCMRWEDEVVWACDAHKNYLDYLVESVREKIIENWSK